MTNEEFQKLVLEKLISLEVGQKDLEKGQKNLEHKIESGFADVIAMSDVTQKEVQSMRRDLRTIEAVTAKNWNDILTPKYPPKVKKRRIIYISRCIKQSH